MSLTGASRTAAVIDSSDRVIADVLCVECGWNLRSYQLTDRCPKCGHPVSDSVFGDYLVHADRLRVRRLSDHARLVFYGAGFVAALAGVAGLATLFGARSAPDAVSGLYSVLLMAAMLVPIPAGIGIVLLTQRRSLAWYQAWLRQRLASRMRQLAAVLVGAALLMGGVGAFLALGMQFGELLLIAWFVLPVSAFWRGFERLMQRLPDRILAGRSRMLFVGTLVFTALALGIRLLDLRILVPSDPQQARLIMASINSTIGLLLGSLALHTLYRACRALEKAAR